MANKTHCDICDNTPAHNSLSGHNVIIDNPASPGLMGKTVRLDVGFFDASRDNHLDLCKGCQRKSIEGLLKRLL